MREIDLSGSLPDFLLKESIIFYEHITGELVEKTVEKVADSLEKAIEDLKIIVVYTKDVEACVKLGELLPKSSYVALRLDRGYILNGKKITFEEFFLNSIKTFKVWHTPTGTVCAKEYEDLEEVDNGS